jgi:hypothetical protein
MSIWIGPYTSRDAQWSHSRSGDLPLCDVSSQDIVNCQAGGRGDQDSHAREVDLHVVQDGKDGPHSTPFGA